VIGHTLSHFRITAKLGEGGMGEVYRAEDSKLGREVAIKVLPEAVATDPERLARFEREAKVLASLNHPNIAGIHQVEEADGKHFLVMELAEGEDLKERIARGPIAPDQAIPIAIQIAEAVEAAHERGIIHRDLKPANVKVTPDGQVKVLDFGLAKAFETTPETEGGKASVSMSPTLTAQMTDAGIILGTAAYMSPEQARGQEADKRSDIWAFGMILAEMLSGRPVFNEPTVSDTLAAVLKSEPDLEDIPEDLPVSLRRLIDRCLRKDPKDRLRDMGDVGLELREIDAGETVGEPGIVQTPISSTRTRWAPLLMGIAVGLVLAFAIWRILPDQRDEATEESQVLRFTIHPPADTMLKRGLAISPDGTTLAFLAIDSEDSSAIWVRRLDELTSRKVPGTSGAHYPFWSRDSKELGFFAGGSLKIVDLLGTPPRDLVSSAISIDTRGGTWSPNGTVLYSPGFNTGLMRVSGNGGEAQPATVLDPEGDIGTHRFPWFLPDGEHFVVYESEGTGTEPGEIHLGELASTTTRRLGDASSAPVFLPPDKLVFARGDVLMAQKLDLEQFELIGDPVPLDVRLPGGLAVSGSRSISASTSGVLVYRVEDYSWTRLVWVDRDGNEISVLGDNATWHYFPRISPDGQSVSVARYAADTNGGDLWIYDRDRGLGRPVVAGDGDDDTAVWSPDGQRLAFIRVKGATTTVHVVDLNRPESELQLYRGDQLYYPADWTPDGKHVIATHTTESGSYNISLMSVDETEETPSPVFAANKSVLDADLSPDGRWLAFTSDLSGRPEVYVRPFVGSEVPWQVSTEGGGSPCWSADGTELYFLAPDGWIHGNRVVDGDRFATETPVRLFDARVDRTTFDRQYDVAPDGTFLLNRLSQEDTEPITVVVGLPATLEQ